MCDESCDADDCVCEPEGCDDDNDKEFCEELEGAAFGLCNAFCNAQQCHLSWKDSCDVLRRNFERQTGQSIFPCEGDRTPTVTPTDTPLPLTATTTPSATAAGTGTATGTQTATGTAASATATDTAAVPIATATSTQLATPTGTTAAVIGTPTSPPSSAQCTCDCDGNGRVSIADLLRSVLVVLGGLPLSECGTMADHGTLGIQHLIRGVHNALEGCS
jgi:hypothetical protein